MSEMKTAPGEWHVGGHDKCTIYDQYGQRIANSFEGVMVIQRSDAECRANARLIAAAPDLLAIAQRVEPFISGFDDDNLHDDIRGMLRDLRAALSKAAPKGEESNHG